MNNTYVHTVQVSAHSVAIELQLQADTFSANHRFPGVLQLGSWTPRHVRLLCCFGDRVIIFRSLLIFLLSFLLTYSVEGLTHEFVSVSYILLMEKIPLCAIKRPLSGLQNFLQQFVICMPTRVLDLNSVFSTVGHGCLSIGTTSWRLQIRVWIIWSTLKQLLPSRYSCRDIFSSRPAGPMTHSLTTSCSVMMTDQFAGFAGIIQPLQSEVE